MRRRSLAAVILAGTSPIVGVAVAQEEPLAPQKLFTATVSQSFEYNSNYRLDDPSPGDTYFADTTLALDYAQETEGQQLGFGLDTGLRALWEAEEKFDLVAASPSSGYFTFVNEGPHLAFDADLRVLSQEVTYTDTIDSSEALINDLEEIERDTRETHYDADIGLTLGPDAPTSLGLRFIGSRIDYNKDTDSRTPRQTLEGQGFWTFRVNPVLSAGLFGSYLEYSADNTAETEVRVAESDAGIIYEPSEDLRITAGLGYADRTRDDFGEETQSDSGPTARGNVTYILPDFILNADGRFTTAAPDPRFSFALRSTYTLQRSQITGQIFNRYTGTSAGSDEARVSGATLGLTHDLNNVSAISFNATYAHQVNLDNPDDPDIDRASLTASYLYDVTSTVTAEIGYGYRVRVEDPEDADSHRIFLVLGRTFETGL